MLLLPAPIPLRERGPAVRMNDEILQGYSISDYLAATENKGWNPDTRRYYTNCLHDLLAFTVQHGVPTPKTMAEWEQSLEQVYTRSAVNVHLAAANNYFKWCGRYDLLRGHTRIKAEQERSPTLTRTEYLKLLRAARSLGKHRIYLLIKLFATTGVPIQCLNQVTAELVKQGSGTLKYRDGAFGFRCPPALQQELLAYMAENGIYRGPVFITRTGQTWSRSNIFRQLHEVCQAAGVPEEKGNPRSLRNLYKATQQQVEDQLAALRQQMYDQMLEMEQEAIGWPQSATVERGA